MPRKSKKQNDDIEYDEIIVEKVVDKQASFDEDEFLQSLGVETEYVERGNGIDIPMEYNKLRIKDLDDGDKIQGKPYLSKIMSREYSKKDKDGNIMFDSENVEITETKNSVDLV